MRAIKKCGTKETIGYSIRTTRISKLGFLNLILAKDGNLYSATNDASFNSYYQAREFYRDWTGPKTKIDYILGPRGGRHKI